MPALQDIDAKRQRAPSQRALATRKRVFDAAERVFADRGFDGATIRDIAAEAGEPVGTMAVGGGAKPALYVELRRNGRPINPLPWLAAGRTREKG